MKLNRVPEEFITGREPMPPPHHPPAPKPGGTLRAQGDGLVWWVERLEHTGLGRVWCRGGMVNI